VCHRLGNPQPFVPEGTAPGEYAQLGMTRGEVGTGVYGGQDDCTETFAAPRPVEERHGLLETVDRLAIVALGPIGYTEAVIRQRVQNEIPAGRGERDDALDSGDELVMRAYEVAMA
jgi:hypothetical protein